MDWRQYDNAIGRFCGIDSNGSYYLMRFELPEVSLIRGSGRWGGKIRNFVYHNSPYYKDFQNALKKQSWDDFQSGMDTIGVVVPTGLVDGINAGIYAARGQYANAGIAMISIVPFGDLVKVGKYSKNVISSADLLRIENAATRINKPITIVGSRAQGTAGAYSDWDYVIEGLNSKNWSKIKNSLPGASSTMDNTARNIDIFNSPINTTLPHITIYPR